VDDAAVIGGGRGVWAATPWNYSSCRFMMLSPDGAGRLIYGYGQTTYAHILCRWEVPAAGSLRLTYLESPAAGLRFKGFSPASDAVRDLRYALTPGLVSGEDNIVGLPYTYLWTLELSEPPWPLGLQLPHEVPRVFYGHLQRSAPDAEPGAAADGGA
jgi:hypothetical protein